MGNRQAGLFDRYGDDDDFDFATHTEVDCPDSDRVNGVMNMPRRERLSAYAHAGPLAVESTMVACLCLEMARPDSGIQVMDQSYEGRKHTNVFSGYGFLKTMKKNGWISSKKIGCVLAQKMLNAKLITRVDEAAAVSEEKRAAEIAKGDNGAEGDNGCSNGDKGSSNGGEKKEPFPEAVPDEQDNASQDSLRGNVHGEDHENDPATTGDEPRVLRSRKSSVAIVTRQKTVTTSHAVKKYRTPEGVKIFESENSKYSIDKVIGQGAYGKVKLVTDVDSQERYAMKVIKRPKKKRNMLSQFREPDALEMIKSEINILKKCRHPNVVLLSEIMDDPTHSKLYLIQEFVAGGAVMDEDELAHGCDPLSYQTAWRLFRDVLNGLEYLHGMFIVHRDLKPSNILVSRDLQQAKIADFGVSTTLDAQVDGVQGFFGTPYYMGPEVCGADGSGSYSGQAADMYGAGATLYSFCYGRVPFTAVGFMDLVAQKSEPIQFGELRGVEDKEPIGPGSEEELKDLLTNLMDPRASKRMQLSQVKKHAWVTRGGRLRLRQKRYTMRADKVAKPQANLDINATEVVETGEHDTPRSDAMSTDEEMPVDSPDVVAEVRAHRNEAAAKMMAMLKTRDQLVRKATAAALLRGDQPNIEQVVDPLMSSVDSTGSHDEFTKLVNESRQFETQQFFKFRKIASGPAASAAADAPMYVFNVGELKSTRTKIKKNTRPGSLSWLSLGQNRGFGLNGRRRSISSTPSWDSVRPNPYLRHKFVALSAQKKLALNLISVEEYTHIVHVSGLSAGIADPFDPKFTMDTPAHANGAAHVGISSMGDDSGYHSDSSVGSDSFGTSRAVSTGETLPEPHADSDESTDLPN